MTNLAKMFGVDGKHLKAPVEIEKVMAGKKCENCRFWSQMVAQSIGNGLEALCLESHAPTFSQYTGVRFTCVFWKLNAHGAVDEPPDYGETARAKYEADEKGKT